MDTRATRRAVDGMTRTELVGFGLKLASSGSLATTPPPARSFAATLETRKRVLALCHAATMTVVFPGPLRPGDRIGVTSPSRGVPADLADRLDFCLRTLRERGYETVVGACMDGDRPASAPAPDRARELTDMLLDPTIRAVVPPWGGELAVEILPHVDWVAIRAADPTWFVGLSDISTVMLPLTLLAGVATVHGQNLMDTPYRVPEALSSWLDVVELGRGGTFTQAASTRHRRDGRDDWTLEPSVTEPTFDTSGTWSLLDPTVGNVHVTGRLIGGCLETVSALAGTPYGDVAAFAERHAPEGIVVYVDIYGAGAYDVARHLWALRLAGWFTHANAVLVSRTLAPDASNYRQIDAVRSALGELDLPVVLDVDCGHVPPHLVLVNGATTSVTMTETTKSIRQQLD